MIEATTTLTRAGLLQQFRAGEYIEKIHRFDLSNASLNSLSMLL